MIIQIDVRERMLHDIMKLTEAEQNDIKKMWREAVPKYPDFLKELPVWGAWKAEMRDGKKTKVPYDPRTRRRASVSDPGCWTDFKTAAEAIQKGSHGTYSGMGLLISKVYDIVFIDADHCIGKDGRPTELATKLMEEFRGHYVELSQSLTGLHFIMQGKIARSFKRSDIGLEMYSGGRFCALTGWSLKPTGHSEEAVQTIIDRVFAKYAPEQKSVITPERASKPVCSIGDKTILERVGKSSERMALLVEGSWEAAGYGSQSEADLALCESLLFWTDGDEDRTDRLFRQTGMYRRKWERADYRRRTLERARKEETLSGYVARKNAENAERFKNAFLA